MRIVHYMTTKIKTKLFLHLCILVPFIGFLSGYLFLHHYLQKTTITTPSLIGKSLYEASVVLAQKNLGLRILQAKEDPLLPEGTIILQLPLPHQLMRPHQCIFVTISKKPQPDRAPDFLGKNHHQITVDASDTQLALKCIWLKSSYPQGTCFAQYPAPGDTVTNRKIISYLSSGKDPLYIIPNLKGLPCGPVQEHLTKQKIQVELYDSTSTLCNPDDSTDLKIVNQSPLAGTIVDLSKELCMQLQVDQA